MSGLAGNGVEQGGRDETEELALDPSWVLAVEALCRGGVGDGYAAWGVGALAGLLAGEVERADALAGLACVVVEQVGRDQPDDLELDAVGVLAVEALGRAVVGAADQRPGPGQRFRGGL